MQNILVIESNLFCECLFRHTHTFPALENQCHDVLKCFGRFVDQCGS